MQLTSETEKPQATPKDLTDKIYERAFADPSEEVLLHLSQVESISNLPTVATPPTFLPATQPQPTAAMPPAAASDAPSDGHPESLLEKPRSPPKSRYRRQSSAPPAEITPTKFRPRITPSKRYNSDVAERANVRRAQPPKSTSPSPPIPSQVLAMKLAPSTSPPSDPSPKNIATDDDPFLTVDEPKLNQGPYPYGNQYPPPRMVPSYDSSYPQLHGFPPMNTPQYRGQFDSHSHYGGVPNYGQLAGMQRGPIPGYPHPYFPQSSNFSYFGVPGEYPYPPTSRESTLPPCDPTPAQPLQVGPHYAALNSAHASGSGLPSNDPKISTAEMPSAPALQPEQSPIPSSPKLAPIAPTIVLPTEQPSPSILDPGLQPEDESKSVHRPVTRISNDQEFSPLSIPPGPHGPLTLIFDNQDFTPLSIPPGPNDVPSLNVSPPTPIGTATPIGAATPIGTATPKRPSSPAGDHSYSHLLDNDSPTVGRLSKKKEKALITGLGELDRLVKEIADSSGLSVSQIVERWNGGTPRSLNSWNVYQVYFKKKLAQEIDRLIAHKKSQSLL